MHLLNLDLIPEDLAIDIPIDNELCLKYVDNWIIICELIKRMIGAEVAKSLTQTIDLNIDLDTYWSIDTFLTLIRP